MPTSLIVRVNGDLLIGPRVIPQVECDDVCEQFQVRNRKVLEMRGRGGGKELVVVMVVSSDTRRAILPTIGRSIEGDVYGGDRDQK